MLIYYLIWSVVSLCAIIEVSINQRIEPICRKITGLGIWIIWSLLIGLVCFKGAVGTDYYSYQYMFEDPPSIKDGYVEPFFLLWMKFVSILTSSFFIFWLITGFLNVSLKFYVIRYLSPFVAVSVLIYLVGLFFERDFDGIRQGISIGLSYWACVLYLQEKKKYKYIGVIICAILFHYTSFLFLFIPVLIRIRLTEKWMYILLGIGLLCVLLRVDLLELIFTPVGYDNFLYNKLYSYLQSENYSKSVGLNIGLIFRIIILISFFKLKPLIHISEKRYNLLLNGFFLAILISLLFNNVDILSHRLAYGFREFQIFIIPYLILAFKGQRNRLLVTAIICLYSLILLHRLLTTPHLIDSYYYKTIF